MSEKVDQDFLSFILGNTLSLNHRFDGTSAIVALYRLGIIPSASILCHQNELMREYAKARTGRHICFAWLRNCVFFPWEDGDKADELEKAILYFRGKVDSITAHHQTVSSLIAAAVERDLKPGYYYSRELVQGYYVAQARIMLGIGAQQYETSTALAEEMVNRVMAAVLP